MTRLKQVTEEVARWVFEVHLEQQRGWFLAFTNPTAGPWKRVMAPDADGQWGEVHRFERDATRPDLVLVSDQEQAIVIVEAKSRIEDLIRDAQVKKTVDVVSDIGRLLRTRGTNHHWGTRAGYTVMCGLLWGGEIPAGASTRTALIGSYTTRLPQQPWMCRSLLLVECLRAREQEHVRCTGAIGSATSSADAWGVSVLQSLNLDETR